MSLYEDRFIDHPIHENLRNIQNKIESLISEKAESEGIEHLSRLTEIITYTQSSLKNVGSNFVPESTLNGLNKILGNISGDLNNFDNTKDFNLFINANNRADDLLIHLQQLPKIETPPDIKDFSGMTMELHNSVKSVLKNITAKKNQLEKNINDQSSRLEQFSNSLNKHDKTIEKQQGRIDLAISQFQSQFSEAEDRRRETFENKTNTRNENYQEFRKKIDSEIKTFLDQKREDVAQTLTSFSEETKKNTDEFKKTADDLFCAHEKGSESTLKFLEQKKEEAKKLVGIIGNIGFTGNYNRIANQEKSSANIMRWIAIIFMVFGIAVISTFVFNISKTGFDWKLFLSRIGVTITIFIPAFYLARESNKHRQREIKNRKMELELASIGPYLELLPEDKKIALKSALTEKLFGQPDIPTVRGKVVDENSLFNLLEKLLTNLTKK